RTIFAADDGAASVASRGALAPVPRRDGPRAGAHGGPWIRWMGSGRDGGDASGSFLDPDPRRRGGNEAARGPHPRSDDGELDRLRASMLSQRRRIYRILRKRPRARDHRTVGLQPRDDRAGHMEALDVEPAT